MSELILFFLFFFLILLGSVLDFERGDSDPMPIPIPRPDPDPDPNVQIIFRLHQEIAGLRVALLDAEQYNRLLNDTLNDVRAENNDLWDQVSNLTEDIDTLVVLRGDAQERLRSMFIYFDRLSGTLTPAISTEPEEPNVPENDPEPVIVTLPYDEDFVFETDSSTITPQFDTAFNNNSDDSGRARMLNLLRTYEGDIAAIEVIGHTDEELYDASDLDGQLLQALNGGNPAMTAVDNAGLGLARAVSTAAFLRREMAAELEGIEIIPLSAAFLQDLNGNVVRRLEPTDAPDDDRRRIEIRVRSSD
ncbi:MAG: hypothetical protein AAF689_11845 [Pseudomonadota bacterium]